MYRTAFTHGHISVATVFEEVRKVMHMGKQKDRQKQLDLYYYESCPYCQKVLRAIRQLGIKDHITYKNILLDEEAAETLVRVGGKRQVPCLFIAGRPMYESDDIVAWLQSTFG